MKIAVYPGSFNPWHKGHADVLQKALKVFDKVVIAVPSNVGATSANVGVSLYPNITVIEFDGLLSDYVKQKDFDAVIRGLRNGNDLQYEMNLQYWNEDLGIQIPVFYVITDRTLSHISSSAIREIEELR